MTHQQRGDSGQEPGTQPPVIQYGGPATPPPGSGVPCPRCGNDNPTKVTFTWWGGLLGPKLLSLVKCPSCRYAYNGKTGKSVSTAITIFSILGILGIIVVILSNLRH